MHLVPQFLIMLILCLLFLLFSLPSFSQQDSIEVNIHILPQFDSAFRNQEISIHLRINGNIDTAISYPFKIKLPVQKNDEVTVVWLSSSLDIGEHDLRKNFSVFTHLISSETPSNKITIDFPEHCDFNINFKNKVCRVCGKSDQVIPVIYGLPSIDRAGHSPFDDFEHYLWGCDMPSCGPTWHCKRDKIEF